MIFSIEYDKQPVSFIKKSDKHIAKRITDKIEELLSNNPVPHTSLTIAGEHGVYRIRIGEYRAVYRINYESKKIIVFNLDKRSKVYD